MSTPTAEEALKKLCAVVLAMSQSQTHSRVGITHTVSVFYRAVEWTIDFTEFAKGSMPSRVASMAAVATLEATKIGKVEVWGKGTALMLVVRPLDSPTCPTSDNTES